MNSSYSFLTLIFGTNLFSFANDLRKHFVINFMLFFFCSFIHYFSYLFKICSGRIFLMYADVKPFTNVFWVLDEYSKLSHDAEGNDDESILFEINLLDPLQLGNVTISN